MAWHWEEVRHDKIIIDKVRGLVKNIRGIISSYVGITNNMELATIWGVWQHLVTGQIEKFNYTEYNVAHNNNNNNNNNNNMQ